MNRQTLIAVSAAIILGLIAVYLANVFFNAAQRRNESTELTKVAVAAVPMGYGTEITPEKVRFANYPKASLPAGSFGDMNQLLPPGERRVALMTISPNEPILADKISGAGKNASLAFLLPDGMRAASVRINDVSGVNGFVQPNDSVDVLVTRTFANGNQSQQITDVLLQDIKVLAMGGQTQGANGQPIAARTATLQVDPLAAQKLALAQEIGSLGLVLRKPGQEQNMPYVETVSLNDLRYGISRNYPASVAVASNTPRPVARPAAPRRPAPKPAPTGPRLNQIDVIRGTSGSQYQVGDLIAGGGL
jgi:pilus assembly protein CpaB